MPSRVVWSRSGRRRVAALTAAAVLALAVASPAAAAPPESKPQEPVAPAEAVERPPDALTAEEEKAKRDEQSQREPETTLVPSLSLSERYDSNVFFVPGMQLEDYVSTARPELKIEHHGRYAEGSLFGGVTAEQYVKNPGLSYIGYQAGLNLDLDRLVRRMSPRVGLEINDYFRYTPNPPSFMAPETGNVVSQAFVEGIQAARANSYYNLGKAKGTYALTSTTTLAATYTNQVMQFGTRFASPGVGQFFNTMFQTIEAGPEVQVTTRDLATVTYQYQRADFDQGGFGNGFDTQGGLVGWRRVLTPTLTGAIAGGAALVQPSNNVQYMGNASLEWKDRDTTAKVEYVRAVRPSFFIGGLPLLNQVVSATVTQQLTERLSLSAYGAYAENESVPDPILKFTSYMGRGALNYQLFKPVVASLSYTYSNYAYELSPRSFDWNRNIVMLTLRAEWK